MFQNASWHAASSAPGAAVAAQSLLTVASVRGRGTPVGAVSPRPPERAPWPGATSQWDDLSHPGLAHLAGMAVPMATLPDTQGRNSRWASKGFLMEPLPRLGSEVGPAPRAPQRGGACAAPHPRAFIHAQGPAAHSWKWGASNASPTTPPSRCPQWDGPHGNRESAKCFCVFWSLNLPTTCEEARRAPGWPVTSTSPLPSCHLLREGLPGRGCVWGGVHVPSPSSLTLGVAATVGGSGETYVLLRPTPVHHPHPRKQKGAGGLLPGPVSSQVVTCMHGGGPGGAPVRAPAAG